jgi:hypothetical protein
MLIPSMCLSRAFFIIHAEIGNYPSKTGEAEELGCGISRPLRGSDTRGPSTVQMVEAIFPSTALSTPNPPRGPGPCTEPGLEKAERSRSEPTAIGAESSSGQRCPKSSHPKRVRTRTTQALLRRENQTSGSDALPFAVLVAPNRPLTLLSGVRLAPGNEREYQSVPANAPDWSVGRCRARPPAPENRRSDESHSRPGLGE